MAEALSRYSRALNKRAVQRCAIICLLSFVHSPLHAEELLDPTRPPDMMAVPVAAGGAEAAPAAAGLQSIIISRNRRAAIIGGETVELGGKYGDAKLIEVNRGSVILHGAQGRQVLSLFPDVKMTAAKASAGNEIKTGQKVKAKLQSSKTMSQPAARKAGQAATGDEK